MKILLEKATRQDLRNHNSLLLLQIIYNADEISRADLARLTHLTRTTVSDVVSGLIEQGLVQEVGQGPAGIGRTPMLLSVVADSRSIIAVNITEVELQGAIVNLRGAIRHRSTLPLATFDGDSVFSDLATFIDGLIRAASGPLLGIGISAPGLIDTPNGIVRQSVNFGWRDMRLRSILQARYSLPIYVANDSHMIALAECMFDQRQQTSNLVAINVGQGIGAGIVLDGRLFAGDEYGAGEIGHVCVEEYGLPCKCGNAGCLETVASIPAIVYRAQLLAHASPSSLLHQFAPSADEVTIDTVIAAFRAGDPAVHQIITTIGRYLGIGVANLIGVLGIRQIVITGGVAPFGDVLRDVIQQEVNRRVLPLLAQKTTIEVVAQGPDKICLGAAVLLLTSELGLTRPLHHEAEALEIVV
jgi:predicted NBD/HSP70 family sugar kinase